MEVAESSGTSLSKSNHYLSNNSGICYFRDVLELPLLVQE
jgi:hypothetical protein